MKRETRAWLRLVHRDDMDRAQSPAKDALDSDARQRTEIRRMKSALKRIATQSHDAWAQLVASASLQPLKKGKKS